MSHPDEPPPEIEPVELDEYDLRQIRLDLRDDEPEGDDR